MALQNTDNPYSFGANTPGGNGSDISGPPAPAIGDLAQRIWGAAAGQQSLADQASCSDYQGWKMSPNAVASEPTGD
jgi:hypothetical protein